MPINIYKPSGEQVAYLCDDEWDQATQVCELENRLNFSIEKMSKGEYLADIGYVSRKEASGGGSVLTVKCMEMMTSIGLEIWFSEYVIE